MPGVRVNIADVEAAIREALAIGRKSADDVAGRLFMSRSTLGRALKHHGTDFTTVRRRVQLEVALERLTGGACAMTVASEVGLTRDYLCVLVRSATGLTPAQIIRAKRLSDIVERWRRHGPPDAWSPLYREQRRAWLRIDAELQRLLADLGPAHPLTTWAKELLVAADRPDFRRQPYRDRIRAQRRLDAERVAAAMWRAVAAMQSAREAGDEVGGLATLLGDDAAQARAA